jgi:uncharacterized integral membrane protein (TIGR00697 family)
MSEVTPAPKVAKTPRKKAEAAPNVNSGVWIGILIAVVGTYLASTMIANVASLRIVTFLGWSIDAGTLIYPLTFTLRDLIHKVAGTKAAKAAIFTGAFVNLLMATYFWWVAKAPADMNVGPQSEWVTVLGPQWRIVIASVVAMLIAELIDTYVYQRWVRRFGHKYQWGRVLSSNGVSSPLDSLVFSFVAFYGLMPTSVVWSIFWSMVWIKLITSVITLPAIYGIRPKQEWTLEGQVK